ncbi:hypothetical protein [Rhizobium sp. SG2393]|uniref:hypothetical protein n=1 Tax=Rhizobium sp. SG2393 TaxID=3276279 RepID=UPI00366D4137
MLDLPEWPAMALLWAFFTTLQSDFFVPTSHFVGRPAEVVQPLSNTVAERAVARKVNRFTIDARIDQPRKHGDLNKP